MSHSQECHLSHSIRDLLADVSQCLLAFFFPALFEQYLSLNPADFKGETGPLSNPMEEQLIYAKWSGNAITPAASNLKYQGMGFEEFAY